MSLKSARLMMHHAVLIAVSFVGLAYCATAQADVYFEQDVQTSRRAVSGLSTAHFKRRIFVLGNVLAIQIEESGKLRKEYGFDFSKNLYYEADPETGHYRWFDLKRVSEAYVRMTRDIHISGSRGRRGIAERMSRDLVEGKLDYPISLQKAYFAKKKIGGYDARLYILREGPGSSFINPFGWYRKAKIWAADGIPGSSEYAAAQRELSRKAQFYKLKSNRVSDLITTLSALPVFPLDIDSSAKRRFMHSDPTETSREITSFISTSPVERKGLLYFSQRQRFTWNTVFSDDTEFGPESSRGSGEPFNVLRALPWLAIPLSFALCVYLWFLGGVSDKDEFSLGKFVLSRCLVLSGLLLTWEGAHYLGEWPFIVTPLLELVLVTVTGAAWITWQVRSHLKDIDERMRAAHLRFCPFCRARCEEFYIECPKCNRHLPKAKKPIHE